MNISKRILLFVLILTGIALSIELTSIYINVNFDPYALNSFCSINDLVDCDGVAKTTYSQFMGIPLAFYGLFLYFGFLFLIFVDKLQNVKFLEFLEVFKNPLSYIFVLAIFSFSISMILACVQFFMIKKICILCFCTYFVDLVIAIISKNYKEKVFYEITQSFKDFISAIKIKKYLITFIILCIATFGILSYTTISCILTPQIKQAKYYKYFMKLKGNPYKFEGNTLGDPNATIIIHEFTDYLCPFCRILNYTMHRIINELDNVLIIHHDIPFDTECNKSLSINMHKGACLMAKYGIASKNQNKFIDMSLMLFEKKPTTEEKILEEAKKLGLDIKKLKEDANSKKTNELLLKDIEYSNNMGIRATPSYILNMKTTEGITPYYELKDKLIKLGAKEK